MRARRVAAVVVGAWLLVGAWATGAQAHAGLESSDPPDGAVLPEAPETLTLTFTEPVGVPDGGVGLLDPSGADVPVTVQVVDVDVVVDLPELGAGAHLLSWRVVSGDGHPITGAVGFTVEPDDATAGPAEPSGTPSAHPAVADHAGRGSAGTPDVVRHAVQTAVHLGVVGAGGLVLFEAVVLAEPRGAVPGVRRRLRRWTLTACGVAAVAMLACVPLTTAWQTGRGLGDAELWRVAVTSDMARVMAAGALGTVVAGVGVLAAGRGVRGARPLAFAGAAVGLGSLVGVGHSRTVEPAALVVTADALHLVVAAVWFGGLLGLAVTLSRSSDAPAGQAARTVARFSGLAAVVLAVLAVTGVVLAWRVLGALEPLWTTGYGVTLLVKVGVAAVVVLLAAWNRYRLVPRVADDGGSRHRLRRTVSVEAGLLAGVLAVTAVLVTQSPTPPAEAVPAAAGAGPVVVERPLEEGSVVVEVTPGVTGRNEVHVTVRDPSGALLDPVDTPRLRVGLPAEGIGPLQPAVERTGPGVFHAEVDLPRAGAWEVALDVRTSEWVSSRATVEVAVGAR